MIGARLKIKDAFNIQLRGIHSSSSNNIEGLHLDRTSDQE
jgi:hypothetical protein